MPDLAATVFATRARVQMRATTAELLDLARSRGALDPSIFDERPPFFWQSEISNDRRDAYDGYMDISTLRNFAVDATTGVAILPAHDHRELPFGYSLTGQLDQQPDRTRVLSDAYTLRGLTIGDVQTDSFIDGVRAGIIRDVSVGFSLGENGWYRCNVCGNDLMDYRKCSHWPGYTYEVEGDDGVIRNVLATFTVIDARLVEYSPVYDGATPSAGILKIQDAARSGDLTERQIQLLEARYRIRLPERRVIVPGATLEEPMSPEETRAEAVAELLVSPDITPDIRALFGLADDADLLAELREVAAQLADLATLRAQAADGRQYRDDLISAALAEGVRAFGATFNQEVYAPLLRNAPLETIKTMTADWRALGNARLPAGRVTVERVEEPQHSARNETPADVYRA